MSLKNRYENVIIRDYKSLGLSHNALDYVLKLEKRIDKAIKIINIEGYDSKNRSEFEIVLNYLLKILKDSDVDE